MAFPGSKRPRHPIRVQVHHGAGWQAGLLREWRWIDESDSTWEGRVSIAGTYTWVRGDRLRRMDGADATIAPTGLS